MASASTSSSSKGPVICVFCASSPGTSPAHLEAARSLARTFHKHSISLVYGGGTVGLMGEVARTLVSLSGPTSVHGIIPAPLMKFEQQKSHASFLGGKTEFTAEYSIPANSDYGRTTIVKDMHSRKQLMASYVLAGGPGSGFVALSGGYGTLEELFEVITWNQLGIHGKGVVAYNVEGYYDGLIQWVRGAVAAGFIAPSNAGILVEAKTSEEVVKALKEYKVSGGRYDLDWGQK